MTENYRVTICVKGNNEDDAVYRAGMAILQAWSGNKARWVLSGPIVKKLSPDRAATIENAPDHLRFPA